MAKVAVGDEKAFEQLYQDLVPSVFRYLRSRLQDDNSIADLAQDTFVTAWRSSSSYRGESSVASWLLGIARHKLLDYLRSHQRGLEREEVHPEAGVDVEAEVDIAAQVAAKDQVQRLLLTLDAPAKELVHLVFVQQLSYREVAQVLGVPEGTVKSRMNTLRMSLRTKAERSGYGASL